MDSTNFTIGGICLAIGAGIGAGATYFIMKNKFEEKTNEEITKVHEFYHNKYASSTKKECGSAKHLADMIENDKKIIKEEFNEVDVTETTSFKKSLSHKKKPEIVIENIFDAPQPTKEEMGPIVHPPYPIESPDDFPRETDINEGEDEMIDQMEQIEDDNEEYAQDTEINEQYDEDLDSDLIERREEEENEEYDAERNAPEDRPPHIITEELYNGEDDNSEYYKEELRYYMDDNVLALSDDDIMMEDDEINNLIGEDAFEKIKSMPNTDSELFVRNEELGIDYDIIVVRGSYQKLVLNNKRK